MTKVINIKDFTRKIKEVGAEEEAHMLSRDHRLLECACGCLSFYVTGEECICVQCGEFHFLEIQS